MQTVLLHLLSGSSNGHDFFLFTGTDVVHLTLVKFIIA